MGGSLDTSFDSYQSCQDVIQDALHFLALNYKKASGSDQKYQQDF